jgi:probable HAF family extracellular repeat protein
MDGDLTGINNSGEIVGTGSGTVGSFSYSNGTYTPIIVPGSNYTNAIGINNLDQIVGYYDLPSPSESVAFGFIYSNGVYTTTINVPGSGISGFSAYTLAYAINDSGVVVGTYIASDRPYGFMYSDGNYTTLDYPGSQATSVNGINDLGEIVGSAYVNGYYGFSYIDGVYTLLSVPGSSATHAFGVNDSGQIVGTYVSSSGQEFGFLYVDGTYTTLSLSESLNTSAVAINDLGQILGSANPIPPPPPVPIPEPATWAMMLLGFAGLSFAGYRRTRKPVSIAA